MNNTMLVLMNDCRLYYYYLNTTSVSSEKEIVGGSAKGNLNLPKKKL